MPAGEAADIIDRMDEPSASNFRLDPAAALSTVTPRAHCIKRFQLHRLPKAALQIPHKVLLLLLLGDCGSVEFIGL